MQMTPLGKLIESTDNNMAPTVFLAEDWMERAQCVLCFTHPDRQMN